jgi:hypothetical protein
VRLLPLLLLLPLFPAPAVREGRLGEKRSEESSEVKREREREREEKS